MMSTGGSIFPVETVLAVLVDSVQLTHSALNSCPRGVTREVVDRAAQATQDT
jgi:hypothetical protein